MSPQEKEIMARLRTEFARQGGRASIAKLTPEERKRKARKAARARWAKRDAAVKAAA